MSASLGPLHSVREERFEAEPQPSRDFGAAPMMRARVSNLVAQELQGMELAPKKRVTVRVMVAFSLRD